MKDELRTEEQEKLSYELRQAKKELSNKKDKLVLLKKEAEEYKKDIETESNNISDIRQKNPIQISKIFEAQSKILKLQEKLYNCYNRISDCQDEVSDCQNEVLELMTKIFGD